MHHFFLVPLTREICLSTRRCTGWLICECLRKSDGRWEINIYVYYLTESRSILSGFSCRGISFIYSSHVPPASVTGPDPIVLYDFCPVAACSQQKPYMSHITLPNPLPAAKTSSCMRRKQKLSLENLFDGGVWSATCLSEPLQAAFTRLCCLICSKACVALGDAW